MNLAKRSFEYVLFLLTGTIIFQSFFFLFNLGINNISFVLATVLYLLFRFFFKDEKKFNKNNIISIIIVWTIIVLLFLYYRNFNECTYDGAYYHGNAMLNMLDGWNPFYQVGKELRPLGVTVWADHYPKATWFFSANLIKLFNNLSAGMIINLLVDLTLAVYGFIFVYEWKNNKILAVIVGAVLLLNPIAIEQMHTYYVDGVLGNMTIILLMLCAKAMSNYKVWDNILIVLVSVFMINVKFTGFGFAGIINLVAWIYLFFKNKKGFIKYTVSGVIMLVLSVGIVGFSPYLKNIRLNRNIFYPIAGDNPEDVISYLIPEEIIGMNFYHKFTYSLTSGKGLIGNLLSFSPNKYLLYDERIGAMGLQFLKILIFSSIGFVAHIIMNIRNKKIDLIYWLTILSLTITIVINYENMWWFRYIPQIWLFVPLGIISLFDNRYLYVVAGILICLAVFNTSGIIINTIKTDYDKSRIIEMFYDDYKGKDVIVQIDMLATYESGAFDGYEIQRAKYYDVNIKEIRHNQQVEDIKPYHMHYYKIYVLESN